MALNLNIEQYFTNLKAHGRPLSNVAILRRDNSDNNVIWHHLSGDQNGRPKWKLFQKIYLNLRFSVNLAHIYFIMRPLLYCPFLFTNFVNKIKFLADQITSLKGWPCAFKLDKEAWFSSSIFQFFKSRNFTCFHVCFRCLGNSMTLMASAINPFSFPLVIL